MSRCSAARSRPQRSSSSSTHPIRLLYRNSRRRLRRHHGSIAVLTMFCGSQCNPAPSATSGITCTYTPAGDGSFSQNVQRPRVSNGEDAKWRVSHHLTVNYGLRYQTTYGLFEARAEVSLRTAPYITLQALQIPVAASLPQDYRKQIAPRLGLAYSPAAARDRVARGLRHVLRRPGSERMGNRVSGINNTNATTGTCELTGGPGAYALNGAGCLQGGNGSTGNLVGSNYKTPYAIHITGGRSMPSTTAGWPLPITRTSKEPWLSRLPYSGGANLLTPLISSSDPNYAPLTKPA